MKLAHARETSLEHLDIGERGDGAYIFGCKAVEKTVHHLAPCPEIVSGRASCLGETGHAALKGVAMDIGEAGDCDCVPFVVRRRASAGFDRRYRSARHDDAHVARPTLRQ